MKRFLTCVVRLIPVALLFGLAVMGGIAHAQMSVHHINVGQADATLLEFKTAAVLIDAGGGDVKESGDHLIQYLRAFFNRRTDLKGADGRGILHSFIITHPHVDHTRHMMRVMRSFTVRNLVDNGGDKGSGIGPVLEARKFAQDKGIFYNPVQDRRLGADGFTTSWLQKLKTSASDVDIRFLNGRFQQKDIRCKDENNDSVVVLISYKQARFLITGDAEFEDERCTPAIDRVLTRFGGTGKLDVDVYKVGHHGSLNGTDGRLLTAMTPAIAVISAGHHSFRAPPTSTGQQFDAFHFGHPREAIVSLLESSVTGDRPAAANVYTMDGVAKVRENRKMTKAVYCTCWDGDIVITTDADGKNLTVKPEK